MATISRSGGYEGSYETVSLGGGGGTVSYSYQMYTIPDAISIATDKGVIKSTGFVSGGGSGTVQIPVGATSLTIRLATNDEGTAWDYSVTLTEQDCAVLQQQYAQAYARYIAARDYYSQQTRVDLATMQQNISDLQGLINQTDLTLALTGVKTAAETINNVLEFIAPPVGGLINIASNAAQFAIDWYKNPNPDNNGMVNRIIDWTQLSSQIAERWFWEGQDYMKNLSTALGVANTAIDAVQASNAIQEIVDARFEIETTLIQLKADLAAAEKYQANHEANRAELLEKYRIANDLYMKLKGECPPTGSTASASSASALAGDNHDHSEDSHATALSAAAAAGPFAPVVYDDPATGARAIIGTDGNDEINETALKAHIYAADGDDAVTTGGERDVVYGGHGNDTIDVGDGFDVVGFSGKYSDYLIEEIAPDQLRITDKVADRDGADLVSHAEVLLFGNGAYYVHPVAPPSVRAYAASAAEDSGELVFLVETGRISDSDVVIPWEVAAGTADASDAALGSGQVIIKAGETTAEIHIPITADTAVEGNETIQLKLGQPTGGYLYQPGVPVIGTILDDEGEADLVVTRLDGTVDEQNQIVTYTLQVSNLGTATAHDVRLREILDFGTQVLSAQASAGTTDIESDLSRFENKIGDLAAGATATVEVTMRADGAGTYVGIAQAATSTLETDLNDNLLYSTSVIDPTALRPADLSLTASADVTVPNAGENVTFTITLQNAGPGIASNIGVAAGLPAGYTLVSVAPEQGTYDVATGTWNVGNVRDGISRTLVIVATAEVLGHAQFVAEVVRADEPDPDSTPGNGISSEDDYAAVTIGAPNEGSPVLPDRDEPTSVPTGLAVLEGNSRNNRLNGTDGDEGALGRGGNDRIDGKAGSDVLFGNSGNDTVLGGDGNDAIVGGSGNDQAFGQAGDDRIFMGSGNDRAFGGDGDDAIWGDNGNDRLYGNMGHDAVSGGRGNDLIRGDEGNDALAGNSGNDTLNGGDGNDWLYGGAGRDLLYGGAGEDAFIFDTKSSHSNVDRIVDFDVAKDSIWLDKAVFAALDGTGTLLAPVQLSAGEFRIGKSAGDSDDRVVYNAATGALYYDADGKGGLAQIQIAQLASKLALTHENFFVV